jgi:hypothetical protein
METRQAGTSALAETEDAASSTSTADNLSPGSIPLTRAKETKIRPEHRQRSQDSGPLSGPGTRHPHLGAAPISRPEAGAHLPPGRLVAQEPEMANRRLRPLTPGVHLPDAFINPIFRPFRSAHQMARSSFLTDNPSP